MERCANKGFVGAMITCYPLEDRQYNLPMYEPLWAAGQDLEMPLSLHFTTNRPGHGQQLMDIANAELSWLTNIDHWTRMSLGHMIYSGVFERYPKLYAGAIETELTWAPHFVDRMDYNYTQRGIGDDSYRFKEDMLPSDYFHRNVFLGFQEDALGIKLREFIGVDKLLWGSDYPHQEGTFPYSQQVLEGDSVRLYGGGEGEDCGRQRPQNIPRELAVRAWWGEGTRRKVHRIVSSDEKVKMAGRTPQSCTTLIYHRAGPGVAGRLRPLGKHRSW